MRLFILLLLLFTLVFSSCTRKEDYSYRLTEFYELLEDKEVIKAFEAKNLLQVGDYIIQKSNSDQGFNDKYNALKKKEGIKFFSPYEISEYYYTYFYKRNNPGK